MDKEINLLELCGCFWRAKFYILIACILSVLACAFLIHISVPKYKGTMIVAPAEGYALGDYASKIQYDRVASLPFWRPTDPEGASTDFYRFIYTLRGPSVSEILVKDESVLTQINKSLPEKIKTPEALAAYLNKNLQVDPMGATPLRKMTYQHPDPQFAAAMLRKIHLVADQMIRRDRRRQSQSRIDYLNNSLGQTVNPEHRKIITNLLMQQEHVQMLANLNEAYAAIVVEPASHSPKAVWPNKTLFYFVAVSLGFVLGFLMWLGFSSRACQSNKEDNFD